MPIHERNYWLDTVEQPAAAAEGPLPASVDVAIVGAGFTGLSAARSLARQGATVAVLEAETLGWGASSRNGGMVLTGLKVGAGELLARYGRERARRLYAASLAAIDCVEAIVREEAIACDFARCGHLEVASKPAHYASFARSVEVAEREFQHALRLVPRDALRAEIGSDAYFGGLVDETSAGLNPARYVAGLARAAARAGARLFEGARVNAIAPQPAGFRLDTARGPLAARDVLVATSGYTSPVTPVFQRRIVPIGSYIIATEPLPPGLAAEVSPRARMIFDSRHFLAYYRLTPDRRMLFGGRAAFFPETPSTVRESAGLLWTAMLKVFPQLASIPTAYAWGGTLDFAFDLMPHAGRHDGLWYALGYAGHGVALATYLGSLLGSALAGRPEDNPFGEITFPLAPLGLYNGTPWFLPFAELWYKFLDWVS
jgi:glycine/D-amino acid oxidase-like deaminating enzyme